MTLRLQCWEAPYSGFAEDPMREAAEHPTRSLTLKFQVVDYHSLANYYSTFQTSKEPFLTRMAVII